jgi:site-specific recombinase XerD
MHGLNGMNITPVVIFVRHSTKNGKPCRYAGDEFAKKCDCRKHLRWRRNGVQYRQKANTRSWAQAEQVKRELEDELSGKTAERAKREAEKAAADAATKLLADAIEVFITDKTTQGLSEGVISGYKNMLDRLQTFCESRNIYTVRGLTAAVMTLFVKNWPTIYPSSITRQKRRERLRSFLRYCFQCQWLERVPAVTRFKVEIVPTLPLKAEEFTRLLAHINTMDAKRWDGKTGTLAKTRDKLRALILLMRWSGLAIRDAVTLEREEIILGEDGVFRVVTSRTKTGTHVSVPILPAVAEEILALENSNPKYLFWTGKGKGETIANVWTVRYIRPLFDAAKVVCNGHMVSHRFRDTFATDLLEKGVPMEEVAKLLGNSLRVCEKHYSAWVKGRQERADALVMGTWRGGEKEATRKENDSGAVAPPSKHDRAPQMLRRFSVESNRFTSAAAAPSPDAPR